MGKADAYLKNGLSVIPTSKDKIPICEWKPFQQALASADQVEEWRKKTRYIGLVTGKVSGNLEMLDIDDQQAFVDWRGLVEDEAPGLFEKLIIESTQNDHFHVAYRCRETEIPGNQKLALRKNGTEVKTLIETRGEGGYFVCDPSPGYRLKQGSFENVPEISKEERETLLACAISLNEYVEPTQIIHGSNKKQASAGELTPGDDYNERGDIRALLASKGWTYVKSNGDYERWRRPGKSRGYSATLINGKHFKVFTSNAYPFVAWGCYSPFAVYAYLEHSADFSKAVKALVEEGFGGEKPSSCSEDIYFNREQEETAGEAVFPYWVMSGVAGEFMELYSAYLEPPREFFYFSFLTCLGNILSGKLTIASELYPQPRLYVVLLGQSADDRKSTAISKTIDFFREYIAVCWGAGSPEGLQNRFKESNNILLSYDEFKQFVSKATIKNSVLLPAVNILFELNYYENATKKTDICIENGHLSLLAASTVQTFENTWKTSFTDIGFNNRLFLVPARGDKKFSIPKAVPGVETFQMREKTKELMDSVGAGIACPISGGARALYDEWYMNKPNSVHAKRLDTYALRLMSLLTLNDRKEEVDEETTRKVLALIDWQFAIRQEYDPIDADNDIAKNEIKIRKQLRKRPMDRRELRQFCNVKTNGLWMFQQALKNLEAEKEIVWSKKYSKYFMPEGEE